LKLAVLDLDVLLRGNEDLVVPLGLLAVFSGRRPRTTAFGEPGME